MSENDFNEEGELTSLPQFKSPTNSANNFRSLDPELSDLLIRKQPRFVPQAPKCAKCEKNVYKAEEIRAANKTYHKLCFKCNACNKLLETNNLTEHHGDLFCRNCYAKNFGPKGYGYGSGAGTLSTENGSFNSSNNNSPNSVNNENINTISSSSNYTIKHTTPTLRSTFSSINYNSDNNGTNGVTSPTNGSLSYQNSALNQEKRSSVTMTYGGSDKCQRCQKSVYAAEKVVAAGKSFHKLCFSCSTCKKLLNSMNCCDNSDGNIFCKSCYGKLFGPKGVGYGIGAGTLQTN